MAKGEAAKKNMFCQYSDLHNEAAVENFLITPLVKQLGYKDSQIKFKKDIPVEKIALGSKSIKYRPDYLLFFDGKPRVVIDAKSPDESLTNWVQQISSYAVTLNQQFEGIQEQTPVFMYACRYVGIDDPKRQRVLPIDRKNREAANKEIAEVAKLFRAFLAGDSAACARYVVQADKVMDRLDVKSCFAKTGRMIPTWSKKGIATTTISDLLDEHVFSEDDTIIPEDSSEEITYLVVGCDGVARQGESLMASDYKGSRLFRVKANQIVVSHINAVHGSIGFVSKELNGCVITSEYTALDSKGVLHPKVICALLRSPEIRSELLVKASGVGRTRIEWSRISLSRNPLRQWQKTSSIKWRRRKK
jgi:type I restriction enzyme M protein